MLLLSAVAPPQVCLGFLQRLLRAHQRARSPLRGVTTARAGLGIARGRGCCAAAGGPLPVGASVAERGGDLALRLQAVSTVATGGACYDVNVGARGQGGGEDPRITRSDADLLCCGVR